MMVIECWLLHIEFLTNVLDTGLSLGLHLVEAFIVAGEG